jgi:hypothetical protein
MTTQREAFEKWSDQFDNESDEYLDMGADRFFAAGFSAALEEAEAACQNESLCEPSAHGEDAAYQRGVDDCVASIRALANRSD